MTYSLLVVANECITDLDELLLACCFGCGNKLKLANDTASQPKEYCFTLIGGESEPILLILKLLPRLCQI